MAHKQIYLAPRRKAWADQFQPDMLKGSTLRQSLSTTAIYQRVWIDLVDRMRRETLREIRALYHADTMDSLDVRIAIEEGLDILVDTMDASIASQARIVMNRLQSKFTLLFNKAATDATKRMVERTLKGSATDLQSSLKDMAGAVTLNTDILSGELNDVVIASTAYAVNLFKRIPAKFLGEVSNQVLGSIQSGQGLKDLIPAIEERGVKIRNYAKNTALDQTRKVYQSINAGRCQALGTDEFEWIHSGGSNSPREYHKAKFPAGLNNGIFRFSDPPVIDERTGEKGIPGQLPNCGCTFRPVFRLDPE